MTETVQYDNLNDIHSHSTLKIETVSGSTLPCIYANLKNQLPIEITVKVCDKNNKALHFSEITWLNMLYLQFAESQEGLNWLGNNGWCFTNNKNDYSKEIHSGSFRSKRFVQSDDGTTIIILYIYTNDVDKKRIAVAVNTEVCVDRGNAKYFTTADIASGAERMRVTVQSTQKIDYGRRENISIISGDFVEISNNLDWISQLSSTCLFKLHFNGTCKRKFVRIYPADRQQNTFKKHEIAYDIATNQNVNQGDLFPSCSIPVFIPNFSLSKEDCFSVIKGPDYPCAVIGRGAKYDDYQVNFWYNGKSNIHLDGHLYLESNSYYCRFSIFVKEEHANDNSDIPTLLLYKFTMPDDKNKKYKWRDVTQPVK